MTNHFGSKQEGIFFSFQTTKPRKKENSSKNLRKTKEKERAKNQAVTQMAAMWQMLPLNHLAA